VCPPSGSTNCDPEEVVATATGFALKNRLKGGNFIWGELSATGELEFVVENLPKDRTGCPGWWMFERMLVYFGVSVTAIKGSWTYGDNLLTVNTLTSGGGTTIAEAAFQGPTGQYALANGFVNVHVVQEVGVPGAYSTIIVRFTK
jgi:hypothetical protein